MQTKQIKPSTLEIIKEITRVIKYKFKDIPKYNGDFEEWFHSIQEIELTLKNHLPTIIADYLPLRKDVWKLAVKEMYGKMPFSKEYVLKNYRKITDEIPYLFYPSKRPERLIILFTGYINYESYNRFSWYFDETEKWDSDTAYLFLGDQSLHWYVGTQSNPQMNIYKKIIMNTLDTLNLSPDKAYSIGASMGGYAAILFATICGLKGAISVHPQLCRKSSERYHLDNWKRKFSECGSNFIDLEDIILKYPYTPSIYLEVGRHPADEAGLEEFIKSINSKNSLFILKRIDTPQHETKNPSKNFIEDTIKFFETQ
ncbi:hypothetical protein BKK51_11215 [Rodentibacter trehalosifermentans]|uniref:Alpha/beta hydrolase n=1 Tax=Rodentibacter trehalosifermentans TaxID=1908263 RepID=A0A1V3IP52_9PAST|nr:hypothetical protein [Rodentibacter trehalosifermentans]OOF43714.1 hypothetical protein BKK51_11215 [Rodentibacter trehalosifermentans]